MNHLSAKSLTVAAACAAVLTGCASVDHTKGLINMKLDRVDNGVADLKSAAKKDPRNASYQVDFLLKRDETVDELVKDADRLRARGEIEKAREAYERVLKMDASNATATSALLGIKQDTRYLRLLEDGEEFLKNQKYELAMDRAVQVLEYFSKNERAIALKDAVLDAKAHADAALSKDRAARYILDAPVTLHFNDASVRTVFEALSRSTGLNILLDRDVKQDNKVAIHVKDVSVSDAIDLVLMQNQLRKRVINGNTLMIYPASASKQDEYEDLVIKTFQVTNSDVKYLSELLKSMLKLREMAADERTGVLVIRDTPENLRLAERLIASLDVPDPEIMLEVKVLEIATGRDSNLGIDPPTGITVSTPSSALTLSALRHLAKGDLEATGLSATVNFKLQDTDTKLLASPRIRARNKEIAKIMIGDRVPTVTNTITPVATGTPVVTGNVTYQDVGLKLEFVPQVYSNNEVGIKIALEVSNIAKAFTDANGGRSYQIGTRNASTNLRLKDGETQILGGLITDEDRNTASKIPGLGHLPFIGRIFGNNAGSATRTEIVLAITPHIIRNLASRAPDIKSIFSGTLANPREMPILADPVKDLKLKGTFGSPGAAVSVAPTGITSSGNSEQKGILINPVSAPRPPATIDPRSPSPSVFSSPPGTAPSPPQLIRVAPPPPPLPPAQK